MRSSRQISAWVLAYAASSLSAVVLTGSEVQPPAVQRFALSPIEETPSFQRHVVPLFSVLGCSGRACHGSFQGQGDFRLSLFGYDFQSDHAALLDKNSPRVDRDDPAESLILAKPTDPDLHGGGLRFEKDSWQYRLLRSWIEAGASFSPGDVQKIERLEVTPAEILFDKQGEQNQLRAVAVWPDGTREDVTCLSRFQSNDDAVAKVDENGRVMAQGKGDTHVVVFYDNAVVPVPVLQPVSDLVADRYPAVPTPTRTDELVVDKLRKLGIVPSTVCADTEFLRRVSLDLTGTLPTPDQVTAFLADPRPDKRARKIDELLETPAYAAWWTTRLCDYTGNNGDVLNNVGPIRGRESQYWYDWIFQRVSQNVPYDQLVADIVLATSRDPDESYLEYCREMSEVSRKGGDAFAERQYMPYFWARSNLRTTDEKAIGFAYTFMGIRIECAQCHKHPFDQWSKQDFDDFKSIFSRVTFSQGGARDARPEFERLVKELGLEGQRGNVLQRELSKLLQAGKTVPFSEVTIAAPTAPRGGRGAAAGGGLARILGGEAVSLNRFRDPRQPLMEWLRSNDNPYFARALVNRVWANYFHVGIVQPTDDMSLANPPSNRPLLDYLAESFIAQHYDMKWLHREITNSRTYQLSWQTNDTNEFDQRNFSHAVPRRLPAEVAYDAVQQATAADATIAQMQRDMKGRAIAMAASGNRTGTAGPQYALRVFGRSTRESNCDCDRSNEASLLQTVFLQNDRDVLALLDRKPGGWLAQVSDQLAPRPVSVASAPPDAKLRQLVVQQQQMKRRIRALGDDPPPRRLAPLERELGRIEKQLAALRTSSRDESPGGIEPAAASTPDTNSLVRQAYLRTLSREPDARELEIARAHLAQNADPVSGLRDVLWALLNTKEFIVNH